MVRLFIKVMIVGLLVALQTSLAMSCDFSGKEKALRGKKNIQQNSEQAFKENLSDVAFGLLTNSEIIERLQDDCLHLVEWRNKHANKLFQPSNKRIFRCNRAE